VRGAATLRAPRTWERSPTCHVASALPGPRCCSARCSPPAAEQAATPPAVDTDLPDDGAAVSALSTQVEAGRAPDLTAIDGDRTLATGDTVRTDDTGLAELRFPDGSLAGSPAPSSSPSPGTVMQSVGDEVFAFFGAPLPMEDPAALAVECARAVQRTAAELDRSLTDRGFPPARFGIGVHGGQVVAAHVGPETRRQYAVVGEAVNLGSRLCGAAGPGEVVVSRAAGAGLDDVPGVRPDVVTLKGVPEPVAVLRTCH
jgi:class 3 adenylate cyclase